MWIALPVTLALMVAVWLASLAKRDASIVDIFWGPGFVLAGWTYFLTAHGTQARKLLVVVLVTVWGSRLALHILRRSVGRGEDYRYAAMRETWGPRFPWVSLFTVFLLQGALVFAISAPLHQAASAPLPDRLGAMDLAGVLVFLVGLGFESVGDWQLARFKADPASRGKVLDRGLWRYTRHPNYFGDALVWWGLFLVALATPGSLWTIYSPALMTFLLVRVSGVSLLEKSLADRRPGYREYMARTSAFVPWFPRGKG